ncbi:putative uncharacterized protein DDB_G0283051 [Drosophila ficusphila]|uniref:putative uncharacterized protein DDB_G0283051 n=1 Tax=Drosophila ficusphila TaxID=30025 RepID=UPI001C8B09E1|nr:putative uncharacterized protein DDB_G0283051 [Drosophila ficusphila]
MDNLRKLRESSYIDEGLQPELAEKFSTKEAINAMTRNCENGKLKTILEAGTFPTMNDAVSKYINCSTQMTGNASTVFYTQRGHAYRGNYRGNYRGRGYGRGYGNNYNRNNGQPNYYNSNSRGNNSYRGNSRSNGGNNTNNSNNNNVRVAQNTSGNSQQPLDTQQK